jgi:hypothetical protein
MNQNGNFSDWYQKSIDFFKSFYEFIIPFAIFYVFLMVFISYLPYKEISLFLQIATLPLAFSIAYFANHYLNQRDINIYSNYEFERVDENPDELKAKILDNSPKFATFFLIYKKSLWILVAKIFSYFVILFCLMPVFKIFYQILLSYNFDLDAINQAIVNQTIELPNHAVTSIFFAIFAIWLTLPFYFYFEYFLIFDNQGILKSLKSSYQIGVKNYFKIIGMLLATFLILFVGLLTCGFGLIVALPIVYLIYYFSFIDLKTKSIF